MPRLGEAQTGGSSTAGTGSGKSSSNAAPPRMIQPLDHVLLLSAKASENTNWRERRNQPRIAIAIIIFNHSTLYWNGSIRWLRRRHDLFRWCFPGYCFQPLASSVKINHCWTCQYTLRGGYQKIPPSCNENLRAQKCFTMMFRLLLLVSAVACYASAFVSPFHNTCKHSLVTRQALWRHFVPRSQEFVWDETCQVIQSAVKQGVLASCLALTLTVPTASLAVSGGGLDYANLDITGQDFSNNNYKGKDFTQVCHRSASSFS